jgi:hypothetical protein
MDVLSPRMFCHHGHFVTTDVCHHGCFVATDVLTPDVLTLRMLCDRRFVTGCFVTGRFVSESMKCPPGHAVASRT